MGSLWLEMGYTDPLLRTTELLPLNLCGHEQILPENQELCKRPFFFPAVIKSGPVILDHFGLLFQSRKESLLFKGKTRL